MNIITNADVKKFLTLLQTGLKNGKRKELKNYSCTASCGNDKDYYVHLEFSFYINKEIVEDTFIEDDFDTSNQINDLLNGLT